MFKKQKILALIPARGGSKGLPDKNIRIINGKPLIGWTIEQALKSSFLDKVVVSTDSPSVASVSRLFGAEVPVMRPRRLATDSSRVVDAILYTLQELEKQKWIFDYVALLEPTSPLRNKNDIDCAIKTLVRKKTFADSLVSIGKICLEHPAYAKKINRRGLLKSYCNNNVAHSRQLLKSAYFPYGVIYLSKVNAIKKHNSVYAGRILPFYIERWQNYEINDIYDFITVEKIMQYRKENEKRN